MTYYVELIQTDPPDSPSPGCAHYAGEETGFHTATEALAAGIARLGLPPGEAFYPCCEWQSPETPITRVVVYYETPEGDRSEERPVQARLRTGVGVS